MDETSDVKKGTKTPGVQRQWCGKVGKQESCIVTVHLGAATEGFHCMLDGELFLPKSWDDDRERCRAAVIPDEIVYRPKWQIALELYDRSVAEGITFPWITADEGYGGKPGFLEGLDRRRQQFVLEVPRTFSVWEKTPETTDRSYRKNGRGRGRKKPRVKSGESSPRSVETVFWFSETMKSISSQKYRIKESEKGPIIWEAKRLRVTLKGSDDLPGMRLWLVVARNVLDGELKFFVSNAGERASLSKLLLVAFQRWRVERCFEDQKQRNKSLSFRAAATSNVATGPPFHRISPIPCRAVDRPTPSTVFGTSGMGMASIRINKGAYPACFYALTMDIHIRNSNNVGVWYNKTTRSRYVRHDRCWKRYEKPDARGRRSRAGSIGKPIVATP